MMTWTLPYKLFNNKHTIKIVKPQMFRLGRRKNLLPSGNPVLLDAAMEENKGKALHQYKLDHICKTPVIFISTQET